VGGVGVGLGRVLFGVQLSITSRVSPAMIDVRFFIFLEGDGCLYNCVHWCNSVIV